MSKKIVDFIKEQLQKSGVTVDLKDPKFADFLSSASEMPQEIIDALNGGLISVNDADKNPAIRKKIWAEALNGVDSNVSAWMDSFELGDEARQAITAEKDTFKRMKLFEGFAKAKIEDAAKSAGKTKPTEEVEALKKQVEKLTADYKNQATQFETDKGKIIAEHEGTLTTLQAKTLLSRVKLALPKEMDDEVKNKIALDAINGELSSKNHALKTLNGKLTVVAEGGIEALDEKNQPYKVDDFFNRALAKNKLLDLTDSQSGGSGKNGGGSGSGAGQRRIQSGAPGSWQAAMDNSIKEHTAALGSESD